MLFAANVSLWCVLSGQRGRLVFLTCILFKTRFMNMKNGNLLSRLISFFQGVRLGSKNPANVFFSFGWLIGDLLQFQLSNITISTR